MMLPQTVPQSAIGLWHRDSITLSNGEVDTTTQVFWAQTSSVFVDLRVPINRPSFTFEEVNYLREPQLLLIGEQKGFAGRVVDNGSVFTWHREIDFRPPNGRPDTGLVNVNKDTLYEQGDPTSVLGIGYREIYTRVCPGITRVALELDHHTGRPFSGAPAGSAFLVIIDDMFMFARSRPAILNQAETLNTLLIEARRSGQDLMPILDCHIAKGRIEGKSRLKIDLSTHPWTEGMSLFDIAATKLDGGRLTLDHGNARSHWHIRDANIPFERLIELF